MRALQSKANEAVNRWILIDKPRFRTIGILHAVYTRMRLFLRYSKVAFSVPGIGSISMRFAWTILHLGERKNRPRA
ncbi:hypothetical protein [Trinickia sp. EG282A]|uniref:hypothetical protein n=1 Tax=Trinickia sp. EG282A TaxID=3237013 RepID=UPI0034D18CF4